MHRALLAPRLVTPSTLLAVLIAFSVFMPPAISDDLGGPGVLRGLISTNAVEGRISSSDVIVYGEVEQLMPDSKSLDGGDGMAIDRSNALASEFIFHVNAVLKGACSVDIQVRQAPSSGMVGYSPPCAQNEHMLFFLKRSGGEFEPVAPAYEMFLPPSKPPSATLTGGCYSRTISFMFFAMADSRCGEMAASFLDDVYDPKLIEKAKPFLGNGSLILRGKVLAFLAHNQDISVIPLVRRSQEEAEAPGESLFAPGGLADYVVPSALPLLNQTLFSTSWQVRLNAETSIIRLHRPSSIPYLMVALYDPERQNIVAYDAYCELSAYMGFRPVSEARFYANRAKAAVRIFNWWKVELSGGHLQPRKVISTIGSDITPSERLFNSDVRIRRAEMSVLDKGAMQDDVPYLILALHDPDLDLSYQAYKTLHTILKLPSVLVDKLTYKTEPDLAAQSIYTWWRGHFVDY